MLFSVCSCPMLRPRPQWEALPCEEAGRKCARISASTAMEPDRCPIVPHGRGVKPFQAVRLEVLYSETCCFVDDLYRGLSGLRAPAGARMTLPRSERLRPSLSRSEERRVGKECVSTCSSRW